jgi:hypothetical protein
MNNGMDYFGQIAAAAYEPHWPCPEDMDLQSWREGIIFHCNNVEVYQALLARCEEAKRNGINHWSIKGFWEIIRYDIRLKTDGKVFKLNNNFTPFYARFLMMRNPELKGFFETRSAK